MKKIFSILSLALLTVGFVACSKSDDDKPQTPVNPPSGEVTPGWSEKDGKFIYSDEKIGTKVQFIAEVDEAGICKSAVIEAVCPTPEYAKDVVLPVIQQMLPEGIIPNVVDSKIDADLTPVCKGLPIEILKASVELMLKNFQEPTPGGNETGDGEAELPQIPSNLAEGWNEVDGKLYHYQADIEEAYDIIGAFEFASGKCSSAKIVFRYVSEQLAALSYEALNKAYADTPIKLGLVGNCVVFDNIFLFGGKNVETVKSGYEATYINEEEDDDDDDDDDDYGDDDPIYDDELGTWIEEGNIMCLVLNTGDDDMECSEMYSFNDEGILENVSAIVTISNPELVKEIVGVLEEAGNCDYMVLEDETMIMITIKDLGELAGATKDNNIKEKRKVVSIIPITA